MVIEEEREKGKNLFEFYVEVPESSESGERAEHSVAEERRGGGGSCSHQLLASCTLVEDEIFWSKWRISAEHHE